MTLFISSSSSWSICCFLSSSARYSASIISRVTTGRALPPAAVDACLLGACAT
jgi:hypothetical protein